MTDLGKLIRQSREQLAAMSPEEKHEMYAAQKASYVRAEMAMGKDADEAAYRADLTNPTAAELLACINEGEKE